MNSRALFAQVECNIALGRTDKLFGGVNVVLCGDFYQFPPVAQKKHAPLYYTANEAAGDTADDCISSQLYQQFDTIVILKQQVQVKDAVWTDLLRHLQYGCIDSHHLQLLHFLLIGG